MSIGSKAEIPKSIPGKAVNPKYEDSEIQVLTLEVQNFSTLDPVLFGIHLLNEVRLHTPSFEANAFINRLAGVDLQEVLTTGTQWPSWADEVEAFKKLRTSYLIY